MDLTKEYQNMLEAAPEIAENWEWKAGDFFIHGKNIEIVAFIQEDYPDIINSNVSMRYIQSPYNLKYDELIPLPRQDQLQDILEDKTVESIVDSYEFQRGNASSIVCESSSTSSIQFVKDIDLFQLENYNYLRCAGINSMEQLCLAFVMHEKFNQHWIKNVWIEQ